MAPAPAGRWRARAAAVPYPAPPWPPLAGTQLVAAAAHARHGRRSQGTQLARAVAAPPEAAVGGRGRRASLAPPHRGHAAAPRAPRGHVAVPQSPYRAAGTPPGRAPRRPAGTPPPSHGNHAAARRWSRPWMRARRWLACGGAGEGGRQSKGRRARSAGSSTARRRIPAPRERMPAADLQWAAPPSSRSGPPRPTPPAQGRAARSSPPAVRSDARPPKAAAAPGRATPPPGAGAGTAPPPWRAGSCSPWPFRPPLHGLRCRALTST
ncbi:basic proline-rich protein-like [Panicum virgatum]|uniref:basic proline-rich protein-like n=1 Tax=Panicum virgatum TaxID=38727 RepID=UPI0019D55382|nr:basic proline-rich protein-like [Panicum virgatum]